jgi:hypothetical protein
MGRTRFVGRPILAAAGFQPALFASRYVGFRHKRRFRRDRLRSCERASFLARDRRPIEPSVITTRMGNYFTRREALLGLTASAGALLAAPATATIETHVHLFDLARVPYAADAPYKPAAYTLEDHLKLVEAAGLAHSIVVHPEPCQDDILSRSSGLPMPYWRRLSGALR